MITKEGQRRLCFYKIGIIWRVFLGALIVYVGGMVFGFAAVKPNLIDEGMFNNLCTNETSIPVDPINPNSTITYCPDQLVRINAIMFFGVSGTNAMQILIGFLIDKTSHRFTLTLGTISWTLGLFTFTFSSYFRQMDEYFWWVAHLSFFFNGTGCIILFLCFVKFILQIPRRKEFFGYHEQITGIINAAFDSSVMYAVYFTAKFAKVPLFFLLNGIIIFILPAMIIMVFFYNLPKLEFEVDEETEEGKAEQSNLIKSNDNEDIIEEEENIEQFETKTEITFLQSLFSRNVLLLYLFMINVLQQQNWFLTTLYDQVLDRSSDVSTAELHNSLFSMLYPLVSIPANLIYARFVTNLNLGFVVLSLLALMNTVIKYLPNTDIQFLMYFLWVPWRACAFTYYFAAFQRIKINQNYIITLTTLGLTTGGLLSLLTAFLMDHFCT
eukprot:gene11932-5333_t